jgi:hypothetical protein
MFAFGPEKGFLDLDRGKKIQGAGQTRRETSRMTTEPVVEISVQSAALVVPLNSQLSKCPSAS